jgi:methionyl-tRNA formyltransferase
MKKVYIASARPIGHRCRDWAKKNTPKGFVLVDDLNDCNIIISVLFDKIFTKKELAGRKAYNFHPGILPQYKGVGTISWAIMNGESEIGVTIHKIDVGVDTGDIIDMVKVPLLSTDTAFTAFNKVENLVFEAFKRQYVLLITNRHKKPHKQAMIGRNYKRSDLKEAKDLTRFIRAFTFEGKESAYYFNLKGEKIYLKY